MISSTWLRTASSEMPSDLERLGGDALALVDQPEQDVLGADVAVVEQARFLLRQHHVFITHGPPIAIGSPIGFPAMINRWVSGCVVRTRIRSPWCAIVAAASNLQRVNLQRV